MNIDAQDDFGPPGPAGALEEPSYRVISYPALATLLVGLFSPLALLTPTLWIIPVLTVVLGAISLRGLAAHPGAIGRRAALVGMVVAILCGTYAWTARTARDAWLGRTAREYADQWVELLHQQRLYEAHQLHGRKVDRAAPGLDLEDFYRHQSGARFDYDQFFKSEPVVTMIRAAAEGGVTFDRVERCERKPLEDDVILRYLVRYEQYNRPQKMAVHILLRRVRNAKNADCDWYVAMVRPA